MGSEWVPSGLRQLPSPGGVKGVSFQGFMGGFHGGISWPGFVVWVGPEPNDLSNSSSSSSLMLFPEWCDAS